jgi:hypothetical protein
MRCSAGTAPALTIPHPPLPAGPALRHPAAPAPAPGGCAPSQVTNGVLVCNAKGACCLLRQQRHLCACSRASSRCSPGSAASSSSQPLTPPCCAYTTGASSGLPLPTSHVGSRCSAEQLPRSRALGCCSCAARPSNRQLPPHPPTDTPRTPATPFSHAERALRPAGAERAAAQAPHPCNTARRQGPAAAAQPAAVAAPAAAAAPAGAADRAALASPALSACVSTLAARPLPPQPATRRLPSAHSLLIQAPAAAGCSTQQAPRSPVPPTACRLCNRRAPPPGKRLPPPPSPRPPPPKRPPPPAPSEALQKTPPPACRSPSPRPKAVTPTMTARHLT